MLTVNVIYYNLCEEDSSTTPTPFPEEEEIPSERIEGADRYATAVAVSAKG
jgi:hypothetical protein